MKTTLTLAALLAMAATAHAGSIYTDVHGQGFGSDLRDFNQTLVVNASGDITGEAFSDLFVGGPDDYDDFNVTVNDTFDLTITAPNFDHVRFYEGFNLSGTQLVSTYPNPPLVPIVLTDLAAGNYSMRVQTVEASAEGGPWSFDFTLTSSVPEPSSFVLAGMGLGGLLLWGVHGRRKRTESKHMAQ